MKHPVLALLGLLAVAATVVASPAVQAVEILRWERMPLVVPLTLLKHHFRLHPDPYIAQQVYLQPHPENLSLRNAI